MSYHIYTTEGIILKRTGFGEANIVLHVLTLELGLIITSARSARLSSSKLRPFLQEFSLVTLSCIKGKNGWKTTNVVGKDNFFFGSPDFTHKVLNQITVMLLKMIQGETPHPEIFETIETGFQYLKNIEEKDTQNFEVLTVLRVLYELGYVAKTEETEAFLTNNSEWNEELLTIIGTNKAKLVQVINKSLKESQL